jgi:hypothetical protein
MIKFYIFYSGSVLVTIAIVKLLVTIASVKFTVFALKNLPKDPIE